MRDMTQQYTQQQIDEIGRYMTAKYGAQALSIISQLKAMVLVNDQVGAGEVVKTTFGDPQLLGVVIGTLTASLVASEAKVAELQERVNGATLTPEQLGVDMDALVEELGPDLMTRMTAERDQVGAAYQEGRHDLAAAMELDQILSALGQRWWDESHTEPTFYQIASGLAMMDRHTLLGIATEAVRRTAVASIDRG